MWFRRHRPSLEVHVPISPTRTFLNMAEYLVLSLRARGGRYRDAPVVLSVGAETRDPNLARDNPWMAALGVEPRWVDAGIFARERWWGTATERMRQEFSSDVVLQLDADVLVAGPLDELVAEAHATRTLCGVVAHLPPVVSVDGWRDIFRAAQLDLVDLPCEHTGWGYLFQDEALRFCPPYFNLGVIAATADTTRRIGDVIYDLLGRVDTQSAAMTDPAYRLQIALSLAIGKLGLPFRALPFRWNFANDPLLEALHASELPHVRIIHLLRRHQLHKSEVFADRRGIEAMLARQDLRVVNAMAQQILAEVHPRATLDGAAGEQRAVGA